MNPIFTEQAQEIAAATGALLNRSVLITDINAMIIGCTNEERVGRFHSPSLPVIAFGKETYDDEEDAQKLGVLPGVTLPFTFFGKTVGTIAIAGDPKEVLPFALVIKKQAEMMLREKLYMQKSYTEHGVLKNLVERIASFDPLNDSLSSLLSLAASMGFDLSVPRITVVFEIKRFMASLPFRTARDEDSSSGAADDRDILQEIRAVFDSPQDICCSLNRDQFVVLASIPQYERAYAEDAEARTRGKCERVLDRMLRNSIELVAGVGTPATRVLELPSTYDEAWKALTLGKRMDPEARMFDILDLQLENLIALSGKKTISRHLMKKLEILVEKSGGRELLFSYQTWYENFFNLIQTSLCLNIHRNTLSYRIEKLSRDTGLDFSNFKQAQALYLAIVNFNMRHRRDRSG